METERIDLAARTLAVASPRRHSILAVLGGLLTAVLPSLDSKAKGHGKHAHHPAKDHHQAHDERKKKKKKKKKPPQATVPPPQGTVPPPPAPPPTCTGLGQSCTGTCCSGLRCDSVAWCGPATDPHGPICYADTGGSCTDACDCRGD